MFTIKTYERQNLQYIRRIPVTNQIKKKIILAQVLEVSKYVYNTNRNLKADISYTTWLFSKVVIQKKSFLPLLNYFSLQFPSAYISRVFY